MRMDVRLVHDAAKRAIDHAREGGGPYILEMMTYRYRGHSMSDPAKYRSKDEVTTMRAERDPIEQVKNRIIEKRFGTGRSLLKAIETEVRAIITEAADYATADAEPGSRPSSGPTSTPTPEERATCRTFLMPALSPTMEEGKLSKWLVKVGDTVKPGDVLAEIETDKATMEVESVDTGKVQSILVPEGTEGVKVNTPIALVLDEGEAAPAAGARRASLRLNAATFYDDGRSTDAGRGQGTGRARGRRTETRNRQRSRPAGRR